MSYQRVCVKNAIRPLLCKAQALYPKYQICCPQAPQFPLYPPLPPYPPFPPPPPDPPEPTPDPPPEQPEPLVYYFETLVSEAVLERSYSPGKNIEFSNNIEVIGEAISHIVGEPEFTINEDGRYKVYYNLNINVDKDTIIDLDIAGEHKRVHVKEGLAVISAKNLFTVTQRAKIKISVNSGEFIVNSGRIKIIKV